MANHDGDCRPRATWFLVWHWWPQSNQLKMDFQRKVFVRIQLCIDLLGSYNCQKTEKPDRGAWQWWTQTVQAWQLLRVNAIVPRLWDISIPLYACGSKWTLAQSWLRLVVHPKSWTFTVYADADGQIGHGGSPVSCSVFSFDTCWYCRPTLNLHNLIETLQPTAQTADSFVYRIHAASCRLPYQFIESFIYRCEIHIRLY